MKLALAFSSGIVFGVIISGVTFVYARYDLPPVPPCKKETISSGPMMYAQYQQQPYSYTHTDPYTGKITTIMVGPSGAYSVLDSDGRHGYGSISATPPGRSRVLPPATLEPMLRPYKVQPLEPGWNNWD